MAAGLEPSFASSRPVWPLAEPALAALEKADPGLAIPRGSFNLGLRDSYESIVLVDQSARLSHETLQPLGTAGAQAIAEPVRKWSISLVASCVFHAAVAMFLIGVATDQVLIEGADMSGIAQLGNGPADAVSSGELSDQDFPDATSVTILTMLEAKPVETLDAAAVPVTETVEKVETVPMQTASVERTEAVRETETLRPETAEAPQPAPAERAEKVDADIVTAEAAIVPMTPDILAVDRPEPVEDQETVQKLVETETLPADEAEAARPVETQETVRAEPEPEPVKKVEPKPVRQAEKKPAPVQKVTRQQKAAAEKPAEKAPAKSAKAGNGGRSEADAARGQSDGQANGASSARSTGGKGSAVGNSAVSNYPGKVVSKLRRALRYPAEAKRQKLRGEVQVSFVVQASGSVGAIRVVASSGSAVLDNAAVETVRRAAPFPAIPGDAGRSSWPFTVPLAFTR